MLILSSEQSFLTSMDWWDSAFKVGLFLAVGLGILIGRGIGGKISNSLLLIVMWCIVYWPLWFVGSILGFASETYVENRDENAATSTEFIEQY